MKKKTLYKKTRLGRIQMWKIWVEEKGKSGFPEVWVEFGLQGGKKQTTYDVISEGVNIGKANETTPTQQAKLEMERAITKQTDEGYRETIEEAQKEEDIDFAKQFPKNLCFYKPKNSIDESKLEKLEKDKKAIFTLKRDGLMHIVRSSDLGLEIYSRRMDIESAKFPHLISPLKNLPKDTILLGEIVFIDKDGRDNFSIATSICRSDPEEAIKKQYTFGQVSYYAFDIAFLKGKNLLTSKTYSERRKLLEQIVKRLNSKWILLSEIINKSHSDAMKEIKKRKLEGLVIWDKDGMMSDGEAFTFNGKAYRPNIIFKSKPKYEDDFIVRWDPENDIGDYGKGKNKGKIKNVFLYQLDDNGNEIYLGKCGGGLSDEQREFYTNKKLFPRVWRIEYDSIQPGTGSLRFPVFNADRTLNNDKEMPECLLSDTIKQAREADEGEEEE